MAIETWVPSARSRAPRRSGFNDEPPIDLPGAVRVATSPTGVGVPGAPAFLAQSAIGQFEVQASPLQMALVAAGVANDGVIMEPYVVERLLDGDGDRSSSHDDDIWRQPISAEDAGDDAGGHAPGRRRPGGTADHPQGLGDPLDVGAKTGTAQLGHRPAGATTPG